MFLCCAPMLSVFSYLLASKLSAVLKIHPTRLSAKEHSKSKTSLTLKNNNPPFLFNPLNKIGYFLLKYIKQRSAFLLRKTDQGTVPQSISYYFGMVGELWVKTSQRACPPVSPGHIGYKTGGNTCRPLLTK